VVAATLVMASAQTPLLVVPILAGVGSDQSIVVIATSMLVTIPAELVLTVPPPSYTNVTNCSSTLVDRNQRLKQPTKTCHDPFDTIRVIRCGNDHSDFVLCMICDAVYWDDQDINRKISHVFGFTCFWLNMYSHWTTLEQMMMKSLKQNLASLLPSYRMVHSGDSCCA
jgi:hypothetical protein